MAQIGSSSAKKCIVQMLSILSYYTKKKRSDGISTILIHSFIQDKSTFSFILSFGKYNSNGTFSIFLRKDTFNQDGHITVNRMDIQNNYHRWVNGYFMRKETAIIFDSESKILPRTPPHRKQQKYSIIDSNSQNHENPNRDGCDISYGRHCMQWLAHKH